MASSIETFVPYHIYERDMERINDTLDKLIEYVQLTKVETAKRAGVEEEREEQKIKRGRIILLGVSAFFAVIGSLVLNLINLIWQ